MKRVGVREFKAHLSQYLREVEAGTPILVTDRGRVLASVRPVGRAPAFDRAEDARYLRLVEQGRLLPASNPDERSWVGWKGLGLPAIEVQAILDDVRGD